MAPVIIYIDDAEKFFQGGGKKAKVDKNGPARFLKDFQTYMKLALQPTERIIFIGTTRHPELADQKQLKTFWDKFIYVPYPDYASRVQLWRKFMEDKVGLEYYNGKMEKFDFSLLAQISEGYCGGAIRRAINNTITLRRFEKLQLKPLVENEFINALANQPQTYKQDELVLRYFTGKVTGLSDKKDKLSAPPDEAGDGKGKKDKGKKGKKG